MRFRAVLVGIIGFALLVPLVPQASANTNMLPNPGFEDGLNDVSTQGIDQPLLPMGWAFEGVAGLFDHSPHEFKSGRYSAAISIPAGGKRKVCYDQPVGCHDNVPLNTAKDTAAPAYSVNPAWRPQLPLPVAAGKRYTISGWYRWDVASQLEGGALVRVRWLNNVGAPISIQQVFRRVALSRAEETVNWTMFSVTVTAPGGATQAVPLFGAADDVFITKVNYDDVSFHPV